MPNLVAYSVSMFGTGDIKSGSPNITITGGVATLSVAQTSVNLGIGVEIEYNSLRAYIVPNRIGFDSGGTAELLVDTKIEGGTSGATGIVRFVELISGSWAGGDAAGWIYFEKTTGTWNASEQINRTKPTSSANIATTNGSLKGNIGGLNDEYCVKTATGGTPANQSSTLITSIHHVWATIAAFEGAFTGANYVNNTDLTVADVVVHCCCYYDHIDYTVDSTLVTTNFGATDANHHLIYFTPCGVAESINSQRFVDGKWSNSKFIYKPDTTVNHPFYIQETYTVVEGLQFSGTSSKSLTMFEHGGDYGTVKMCIYKDHISTSGASVYCWDTDYLTVENTIIEGSTIGGIRAGGTSSLLKIRACTLCGVDIGTTFDNSSSDNTVKNCVVFDNADDYFGTTATITYSASDDTQAGTGNIDWDNGATDWANVFKDYANGDFSLNNFTGTGTIIGQGIDLAASEGIWRDIAGNERKATPDIGAFEYVAAVGGLSATPTGSLPAMAGVLTRKVNYKRTLTGAI